MNNYCCERIYDEGRLEHEEAQRKEKKRKSIKRIKPKKKIRINKKLVILVMIILTIIIGIIVSLKCTKYKLVKYGKSGEDVNCCFPKEIFCTDWYNMEINSAEPSEKLLEYAKDVINNLVEESKEVDKFQMLLSVFCPKFSNCNNTSLLGSVIVCKSECGDNCKEIDGTGYYMINKIFPSKACCDKVCTCYYAVPVICSKFF